ncbi:MAG: TIGR04283 family arsenosugar biosynthesis glycosyltransferase [Cellulophaga sp.]
MKQNNSILLSIVIPVLNEAEHIGKLITHLWENSSQKYAIEIIVVDGGSIDNTVAIATDSGATVFHSKKGRAKQMNFGARKAKGDILYFLHADTFPPKHFDSHILKATNRNYSVGCFRMKFDSTNKILQLSGWMTRINLRICRGGDQSLFITKELFVKSKGFNEGFIIYEDNEFIGRMYQMTTFTILPYYVSTSARKYKKNGVLKLQYHFSIIHLKKLFGTSPTRLYEYYKRNIE